MGPGEAEAVEYARRQADCAILLDDRVGRRAAQGLGLRVFGTLSILAAASRQGHVGSFAESVERVRAAGLYVSDSVVDAVQRSLPDR
jgi:predicted nucleic acid-binding protein